MFINKAMWGQIGVDPIERKLGDHDEQIQAIFEAIRQLMAPPDTRTKKIGFTVKEKQKAYAKGGKKKRTLSNWVFAERWHHLFDRPDRTNKRMPC
jgi:hypothetical protein